MEDRWKFAMIRMKNLQSSNGHPPFPDQLLFHLSNLNLTNSTDFTFLLTNDIWSGPSARLLDYVQLAIAFSISIFSSDSHIVYVILHPDIKFTPIFSLISLATYASMLF